MVEHAYGVTTAEPNNPAVRTCWLNHQEVFLFDNSTNHTAFAHNAYGFKVRICLLEDIRIITCGMSGTHGRRKHSPCTHYCEGYILHDKLRIEPSIWS